LVVRELLKRNEGVRFSRAFFDMSPFFSRVRIQLERRSQMWLTRILLVASLTVQTAVAQAASPPIRVRLTGVDRYDIPGVITIEETRISGRRPVTRSPSMIRFSRTDSEPAISVLPPGRRVTGEARQVDRGLLEFISDDDRGVSLIPTDSIALVERQKAATASRETAAGFVCHRSHRVRCVIVCAPSCRRVLVIFVSAGRRG
jgi:hypothetical protein